MSHVLALDAGTTSCRAIVFDHQGQIAAIAQREFPQYFPQPGWVEHDAVEIWTAQAEVAVEALARAHVTADRVVALGITNQRETVVLWDRRTGVPISRAIVWQDRRTAAMCQQLKEDGCEAMIQERTGLLLDAYFSGSKVAWILEHVPEARQRAQAGELCLGTIDSWLAWNLTGGAAHVTDPSNASRTMLFNIHTGAWDPELLQRFDVPPSLLPEIRSSSEVVGRVTAGPAELRGIPLAGLMGDQQAALFGQLCLQPGQIKTTYGTGCFMLQCTGTRPATSHQRLLTTVAGRFGEEMTYALEGSVFMGGAVVQWLRDGLGLIATSAEVSALARSVPDAGGVCLVPAFAGLGAPYWDPLARGLLIGLTRGTTKAHVARAALESIAYQVADLLDAMQADSGLTLTEMRVDGGATNSDLLMQFQANLLGLTLIRPAIVETTALGAAYLAGLAVGFWKDTRELATLQKIDRRYDPQESTDQGKERRARWRRAVARARDWETELPP